MNQKDRAGNIRRVSSHGKKPQTEGKKELPSFSYVGKKQKWYFLTVFILLNIFLSAYFLDTWMTPNAVSRALPVLSLYKDKTLTIDPYHNLTGDISFVNGHYYSDKAPLSSFVVFPFYWALRTAGWGGFDSSTVVRYPIYIWEAAGMKDGRSFTVPDVSSALLVGSFVTGTLPFVLIILLTFLSIRKFSPTSPALLAMSPFYASFVFVFAGAFFGHVLAGFFLLAAYLSLRYKKYHLWGGLALGLAFATEYSIAVIIPFWVLQLFLKEKSFRNTLLFILGMIPGGLFILIYNYKITGSPLTPLYTYVAQEQFEGVKNLGFSMPSLEALWGLLFTSNRGMFFYAPALILMAFYMVRYSGKKFSALFSSERKEVILSWGTNYLLSATVFYLLLISSHLVWTGGWSYGPRHLIPLVILLLYEGAVYLSRFRFSRLVFAVFIIAGLLMAWMAKSTKMYMLPDWPIYTNPFFEIIVPDFSEGKFNTNNIGTWRLGLDPQLAAWLWIFLAGIFMIVLDFWNRRIVSVKKTSSPGKS